MHVDSPEGVSLLARSKQGNESVRTCEEYTWQPAGRFTTELERSDSCWLLGLHKEDAHVTWYTLMSASSA